MDKATLGWVAGLLEGEGCFHLQGDRYARITLQMADEDVVRRLHSEVGKGLVRGPWWPTGGTYPYKKPMWRWTLNTQADVAELMTAILPLMGERRQAKIRLCLSTMEDYRPNPTGRPRRTECKRGHPMTEGHENVYVSPKGHRACITCYEARTGTRLRSQPAVS